MPSFRSIPGRRLAYSRRASGAVASPCCIVCITGAGSIPVQVTIHWIHQQNLPPQRRRNVWLCVPRRYQPNMEPYVWCGTCGASLPTIMITDLLNVFETFLPQLLLYPNPTDPLNGEAAALLMREPESYNKKVRGAHCLLWWEDGTSCCEQQITCSDLPSPRTLIGPARAHPPRKTGRARTVFCQARRRRRTWTCSPFCTTTCNNVALAHGCVNKLVSGNGCMGDEFRSAIPTGCRRVAATATHRLEHVFALT